jgi:hypothetical protein
VGLNREKVLSVWEDVVCVLVRKGMMMEEDSEAVVEDRRKY